jgi:hypothetical protein
LNKSKLIETLIEEYMKKVKEKWKNFLIFVFLKNY